MTKAWPRSSRSPAAAAHVRIRLGHERGREHLSGSLQADLVERESQIVSPGLVGDYPEHRRTPFPPAFHRHRFRQAGRYATSTTESRILNFCS
jgi:hypothetical protein